MQRDVHLPTRLQALAALVRRHDLFLAWVTELTALLNVVFVFFRDPEQWRHLRDPAYSVRFLCVFHPHLASVRTTPVAALAPCKA
jgi:hypothetical protein